MVELNLNIKDLEKQKVVFEHEREEAMKSLAKERTRLEKEVQLRLFFEQKVNSIYKMNSDLQSKYNILDEKYKHLTTEHDELMVQHESATEELLDLRQFKAFTIQEKEDIVIHQGVKELVEENLQESKL